jgi:putative Mg2+ transporter-C (MgtC) family protein
MGLADIPWSGLLSLPLSVVLGSVLGVERAIHGKSAGVRTHALVALGAALFTVSGSLMGPGAADPARVAAQVVSGIGFLGGGLIFVRQDIVRGLTTAASVWVAAAVGLACGANLLVLGVAAAVLHLVITYLLPPMLRRIQPTASATYQVDVTYRTGGGILRDIISACTSLGWTVEAFTQQGTVGAVGEVDIKLILAGVGDPATLTGTLVELPGTSLNSLTEIDD